MRRKGGGAPGLHNWKPPCQGKDVDPGAAFTLPSAEGGAQPAATQRLWEAQLPPQSGHLPYPGGPCQGPSAGRPRPQLEREPLHGGTRRALWDGVRGRKPAGRGRSPLQPDPSRPGHRKGCSPLAGAGAPHEEGDGVSWLLPQPLPGECAQPCSSPTHPPTQPHPFLLRPETKPGLDGNNDRLVSQSCLPRTELFLCHYCSLLLEWAPSSLPWGCTQAPISGHGPLLQPQLKSQVPLGGRLIQRVSEALLTPWRHQGRRAHPQATWPGSASSPTLLGVNCAHLHGLGTSCTGQGQEWKGTAPRSHSTLSGAASQLPLRGSCLCLACSCGGWATALC